ncbi:hypothetical protein ONS95_012325 [Cadophora gregata]|uniref:uncharacterized protein n=1 Tax=Cadophora gregata TaxID=51156 RepID=UPI0026DB2919|nr:uncharacterized protein ONS95_012325 [Cadophora gregata]KAK0118014.1 hypothetical protein ONS95_012325 [Cadophora gregata]
MAVLDILPGIEVVVCVDDEPLAEIATENDEIQHPDPTVIEDQKGCTKTNYVQSTTGKTFTIYIKASDPYDLKDTDLIFHVEVDGNFIKAPLLLQADYEDKFWDDEVEGPVIFNGEEAIVLSLTFTAIKTTSKQLLSKAIEKQKKVLESVGLIEVGVYRARCTGEELKRSPSEELQTKKDMKKADFSKTYHSKVTVKENISHGSSLSDAKPAGDEKMFITEKIDGEEYPIGLFKFKYRSKKALKELGVIPRTPSPESSPAPPHIEVPTPATTPTPIAAPIPAASPSVASGSSPTPNTPGAAFRVETYAALIERHKRELDEVLRAAMLGAVAPESVPDIKPDVGFIPGMKRDPDGSEAGVPPTKKKKQKRKLPGKLIIDLTSDDEGDHSVIELES